MIIDECALFEDYRRRGLVFVTPEEDRILQRDKVSWALSLTEEEVASRLKIAQRAQKIRENAISTVDCRHKKGHAHHIYCDTPCQRGGGNGHCRRMTSDERAPEQVVE